MNHSPSRGGRCSPVATARMLTLSDSDRHVEVAKLETEFLELNLLADLSVQRQLESLHVASDGEMALLDQMQVPESRTKPRKT